VDYSSDVQHDAMYYVAANASVYIAVIKTRAVPALTMACTSQLYTYANLCCALGSINIMQILSGCYPIAFVTAL
jgi:hypothetical protein